MLQPSLYHPQFRHLVSPACFSRYRFSTKIAGLVSSLRSSPFIQVVSCWVWDFGATDADSEDNGGVIAYQDDDSEPLFVVPTRINFAPVTFCFRTDEKNCCGKLANGIVGR